MNASHEQHEQPKDWPRLDPRVWIASLSDYDAGRLHGEWVDAAVDEHELRDAIRRILDSSPDPDAEGWAIFDYDNFGAFKPGEHEDLATVAAIGRGIEKHGFAFSTWADISDTHISDLEVEFEGAFMGHFDSKDLLVDSILDDFDIHKTLWKALPAWLASHITIDREGIARDMQTSEDLHIEDAPEGGVYVFRGCPPGLIGGPQPTS